MGSIYLRGGDMDMDDNFIIEKSSDSYIPKIFLDAKILSICDIVANSPRDNSITPTQITS